MRLVYIVIFTSVLVVHFVYIVWGAMDIHSIIYLILGEENMLHFTLPLWTLYIASTAPGILVPGWVGMDLG